MTVPCCPPTRAKSWEKWSAWTEAQLDVLLLLLHTDRMRQLSYAWRRRWRTVAPTPDRSKAAEAGGRGNGPP